MVSLSVNVFEKQEFLSPIVNVKKYLTIIMTKVLLYFPIVNWWFISAILLLVFIQIVASSNPKWKKWKEGKV